MYKQRPWYREFWFWVVVTPPIAAVLAGVATVIIAVQNADSLVVDDYQKTGLTVSKIHEHENRARELNISAQIQLNRSTGKAQATVTGGIAKNFLQLELLHPTQSSRDLSIRLLPAADGIYTGDFSRALAGRWNLRLSSPTEAWLISATLPDSADHITLP
ncbi:MAG: FixH family protein [Gammaproteobacteria bacterium]|nr:FixH family protein [Gammaproteobacteria bacterium]